MRRAGIVVFSLSLVACASTGERATLAQLHDVKIEIKEVKVDGGIEKAIEGYRRFLAKTDQSPLAAEATRRLADLKVEKEYGILGTRRAGAALAGTAATAATKQPVAYDVTKLRQSAIFGRAPEAALAPVVGARSESDREFEERATARADVKSMPSSGGDQAFPEAVDLERAGAREAVELYQRLLEKYPRYDRKDQVLYEMARAYEELGEVNEAMKIMNRLVKEHPGSRYYAEVQFRRGEFFFTRKKIIDAEEAYKSVAEMGPRSLFYELALYKLGWTYYKQEMYEEALDSFVTLLDYKASSGFDFEKTHDELEKKRVEDTYRVISLSFSNSGGSNAIADYFAKRGKRPYEVDIYRNLAEFYLDKRRYNDAALTYKAFVKNNPLHKVAPRFDMQVIDTYRKGAFPKLVIDATKEFARNYGVKSEYWKHFDLNGEPEVVGYLKKNLKDLATHYHALYQDKTLEKDKDANFEEAVTWYRESLDSFPRDAQAPAMNYQLADLLLEKKAHVQAALEYEKTAYDYPTHEKSAAAGYAAVYARREALKGAPAAARDETKLAVIATSLRFADTFPQHEKAAVVLGAAAEDMYQGKDYARALATARKVIDRYPNAEHDVRRAAWLVVAHASLELEKYEDAEQGYATVLGLMPPDDKTRAAVTDNLAASIYKQGEAAMKREDRKLAARHFLRVAQVAPTSKIRPVADYDGAAALVHLKEWDHAIEVLQAFRQNYPSHELQAEVTKKLAFAQKETGHLALAAAEYERVETETKDEAQRRNALLAAADFYEQAGEKERALRVYRRYVDYFPQPLEAALETRHKVARLYKAMNDVANYLAEHKRVVDLEARAGDERTERTRYFGGLSALALTEPLYERFADIKLVKPFQKNLARKKAAMKEATDAFGKLVGYRTGEVTAAATYYIAEIYYQFGRALTESERPTNLKPVELEQYELALEEQAYPFEEKAISVHEKNIELLGQRVYNAWIDKSLDKLAKLVPARYAKTEESAGYIDAIGSFRYQVATTAPSAEAPQAKAVH